MDTDKASAGEDGHSSSLPDRGGGLYTQRGWRGAGSLDKHERDGPFVPRSPQHSYEVCVGQEGLGVACVGVA